MAVVVNIGKILFCTDSFRAVRNICQFFGGKRKRIKTTNKIPIRTKLVLMDLMADSFSFLIFDNSKFSVFKGSKSKI